MARPQVRHCPPTRADQGERQEEEEVEEEEEEDVKDVEPHCLQGRECGGDFRQN